MEKFYVGEEVLFSYGLYTRILTVVKHITPTGRVRVEHDYEKSFSPDGWEMGVTRQYRRSQIKKLTPETREQLQYELAIRKLQGFNWSTLKPQETYAVLGIIEKVE